jgi:hypothetical protein
MRERPPQGRLRAEQTTIQTPARVFDVGAQRFKGVLHSGGVSDEVALAGVAEQQPLRAAKASNVGR